MTFQLRWRRGISGAEIVCTWRLLLFVDAAMRQQYQRSIVAPAEIVLFVKTSLGTSPIAAQVVHVSCCNSEGMKGVIAALTFYR